jgi:hypothetical protein
MNVCQYCDRTVPGLEKICKDCYAKLYSAKSLPPPTLLKRLTDWYAQPMPDVEPTGSVRVPLTVWFLAGVAGWVLYGLFSFADGMFLGSVLIVASGVIAYEYMFDSVRMSRPSVLYWVVTVASLILYALGRWTGNTTYPRLGAVGGCLIAAYIVIERRRVI